MKFSWQKIFILTLAVALTFAPQSKGATVEELQGKITDKSTQIEQLEKEIQQYQKELTETGKQAQTLQNAVKTLDTTAKKLAADVRLTEQKISVANDSISDLSDGISVKEEEILQNLAAIEKTLRNINAADDATLIEIFLSNTDLSEFWNEIENLQRFQIGVREKLGELRNLKVDLQDKKTSEEKRKKELVFLKSQLADQQKIVTANKLEKSTLLKQTQNKESEYKKLLTEKQKQKEAFERELAQYESDLKIAIDPNSIPKASAIFTWPFDTSKVKPLSIITQLFGGTEFAKLNPQVYGRPFHNGTDFGMPVGTPILSALGGVVEDSGNTDAFPGCYSYGKWVLVKHSNGLSTLYAHLSLIKVTPGSQLSTGSLLGYSGNTGYSTGPHLHFTVYLTKGVQVIRFGEAKKVTNCADARIPIAPYDAYLDPMLYLPSK
ncbi:MAG: peptidoglycan DD-metalloendopeptidase family protein [Patescibacteria group bacterium]|nr:peptidoglycan DD-metalloendopeptidase family protein [bacterium]MDZ4240937.1 peptidoglycan DD-metalloendopeptidase family protein [Patescibacteria group bacterium]